MIFGTNLSRRTLLGASVGVAVLPLAAPACSHSENQVGSESSRPSDDGDLQQMLVNTLRETSVVGASVCTYTNGKWSKAAAGYADFSIGEKLTTDHLMHIGSITKVINATLLMQMVDEGRVSLDSRVTDLLPDFVLADRDALARLTVGMLINHTSGIDGDVFVDRGPDKERIVDAINQIASSGQVHAPGSDMSYSNAGTVVAGYLCQLITGTSWYELIQKRIFQPLGLMRSTVDVLSLPLHQTSVGHWPDQDGLGFKRSGQMFLPPSYSPAGAVTMMTAEDLVRFAVAHMNGGIGENGNRILSPEAARLMQAPSAHHRGPAFYPAGYGWLLTGDGIIHHGGGGPGIVSWLYAHPETRSAIAVLTNSANGGRLISRLTSDFLRARNGEVLGDEAGRLIAKAAPAKLNADAYIGEFHSVAFMVEIFGEENGRLVAAARAKGRYYEIMTTELKTGYLTPIGDDTFASDPQLANAGVASVLRFLNPDDQGRMQNIAQGGRFLRRLGT